MILSPIVAYFLKHKETFLAILGIELASVIPLIDKLKLWHLFTLFAWWLFLICMLFEISRIRHRGVKFYSRWENAPSNYKIDYLLNELANKPAKLEIIGRSCFRWLCGNELLLKRDPEHYKKQMKDLQGLIKNAIKAGSSIHFIIQNPNISIPWFSLDQNSQLKNHIEKAMASYESIHNNLISEIEAIKTPKGELKMFILNSVIDNSMTRYISGSEVGWLIYDISTHFQDQDDPGTSKPFLVFNRRAKGIDEFIDQFDTIKDKSQLKEKYDEERKKGLNEANDLIKNYSFYSAQRRDTSNNLAKAAAQYFIASSNHDRNELPPPISIQLLITNKCTTNCVMCDHFKITGQREMNISELHYTIDSIYNLGTRSVIISGGEPLSRKQDLLDLLNHCESKKDLKIGLLTNGVVKQNNSYCSISREDAIIIRDRCDWVQVSIDSFDKKIYESIRNAPALDPALESVRIFKDVGCRSLEVCYTIQKGNIREVSELRPDVISRNLNNVPLRFKFAHGSNNTVNNFLCGEKEIQGACEAFATNLPQTNSNYILNLIDRRFTNFKDLAEGAPIKTKMIEYLKNGYKCHILRMTCKIDPYGDVYPCCFLFDDNNADSKYRESYLLGSLKSAAEVITDPSVFNNKLAEIWHKNTDLRNIRDKNLPIESSACNCCTRHFYQNEFLNKLEKIFIDYRHYRIAEEFEQCPDSGPVEPFWL
jgi:MoaA/NifB/PqqE/SkfB family radical SAM enzyme